MLSKNQIKFINSLKIKKFRDKENLFLAEGTKIVPELVYSNIEVKKIYATNSFINTNTFSQDIEIIEISENELAKISSLATPNEVVALCSIPNYAFATLSFENKITLALDEIKDPGNLGTIIRIADWFGIDAIICSNESADAYNPKVIQATMGSISRVKVIYTNLIDFLEIESSKKNKIYGATLDGKNIYNHSKSDGIIVIGNESKGISEGVLKFVDNKLKIPSYSHLKTTSTGEAESLNAAIATAIICSEFRR